MTTVAFKDGVLAADTLVTANGCRDGHQTKIYREGRLLIGFCGKASNFERFRSWVRAGAIGEFVSADGNVFIVKPDGKAIVWGSDYPWRESRDCWALGSGEQFAMGAMAAGASAAEAVRVAMQIDTSTGGDITVLALHASDCATHNAPAVAVGLCDCA